MKLNPKKGKTHLGSGTLARNEQTIETIKNGTGSEKNLKLKNYIQQIRLLKDQIQITFIYKDHSWQQTNPTHTQKTTEKNQAKMGGGQAKEPTENKSNIPENNHKTAKNDHINPLSQPNKANTDKPENQPLNQISTNKAGTSGSGAGGQDQSNNSPAKRAQANQNFGGQFHVSNLPDESAGIEPSDMAGVGVENFNHLNNPIHEPAAKELVRKLKLGTRPNSDARYFILSFPFEIR